MEDLGSESPRAVGLTAVTGPEGPTGEAVFDRETVPELEAETALEQISEWLQPYPAARGAIVETQRGTAYRGGPSIRVRWDDETDDPRPSDEVAPFLNRQDSGMYLRPALNANDDTLSPLAVWFATLLALSSLARYHPERWTRALNRDRSTYAIPIEESLDVALEILPWLLLGELTRDRQL